MSTSKRESNRSERAAAITAAQARKERNQRLAVIGVVVVVLGAIVAAGVWLSGGGGSTPTASDTGSLPKARVGEQSLIVGNNPDAKVKVVIYEDFLCPFCHELEETTRDFLHRDAKAGKVVIEYRPFQLLQDPYSKRALNAWAAVLEHGTPAQALRYHDLLYDKQPYENASDKPSNAQLAAWAKQVGAGNQQVLDAIDTENTTFYTAAEAAAQKAKVQGTPTVLVNGKQLQGSSIDQLAANLEKTIAGS